MISLSSTLLCIILLGACPTTTLGDRDLLDFPTPHHPHGGVIPPFKTAVDAGSLTSSVDDVNGRNVFETAAAAAPQQLRICAVVHDVILSVPMFAMTWANANKARYLSRGVNVTARIIGTTEALPWATKAARAVVQETDRCDAFFGTAVSSLAQVAAVVVSKVWIDLASSSSLSDKTQYPFFNRFYLDSRQDGVVVASMIRGLGITAVHTLCIDEAYGRSSSEGFTATAQGIDIVSRRCFLATATRAEIVAIVKRIAEQKDRSHWVYLALSFSDFPAVFAAVEEAGLNTTLTFLTARCTSTSYTGLICITPALNDTRVDEVLAARDSDPAFRSQVIADLTNIAGVTSTATALTDFREVATITDGMEMLVEAYVRYKAANPTRQAADHQAALRDFMRANVTLPASVFGPLSLDAKGDRFVPRFNVFNVPANKTFVKVGTLDRLATKQFTKVADVYLPSVGTVGFPLPTKVTPPSSGSSRSAVVWIAVGLGVLIVALVAAIVVVLVLRRPGDARSVANAPTDDSQPFAIVFTDIQASTAMWARVPVLMGPGLDAHNTLIREQITKHHGYEVKTIGDSFMVAFKSVSDAAAFSVEIQSVLWRYDWGTLEFDQQYAAMAAEKGQQFDAVSSDGPWHGLRVRVGVSYGLGKIAFDDVSKGYDYYGTVVNTAARIEGVAHGGQVLITETAHEALACEMASHPGLLAGQRFEDLGPQPLRGLADPVVLHQWRCDAAPLSKRTYPPLRLDVENVVDDRGRTSSFVKDGDNVSVVSSHHKDAASSVAQSLHTLARAAAGMAGTHLPARSYGTTTRRTSHNASKRRSSATYKTSAEPSPQVWVSSDPESVRPDKEMEKDVDVMSDHSDDAAAVLQQSYTELVALLRPAMAKKEQQALFERVAKAWRVQDPATLRSTRHLAQGRESKVALMLMAAMLKGKVSATVQAPTM